MRGEGAGQEDALDTPVLPFAFIPRGGQQRRRVRRRPWVPPSSDRGPASRPTGSQADSTALAHGGAPDRLRLAGLNAGSWESGSLPREDAVDTTAFARTRWDADLPGREPSWPPGSGSHPEPGRRTRKTKQNLSERLLHEVGPATSRQSGRLLERFHVLRGTWNGITSPL